MPADYLSRLPSLPINAVETPKISALHLIYNCYKEKIKIYRPFSTS
jgi:hypothetical protein